VSEAGQQARHLPGWCLQSWRVGAGKSIGPVGLLPSAARCFTPCIWCFPLPARASSGYSFDQQPLDSRGSWVQVGASRKGASMHRHPYLTRTTRLPAPWQSRVSAIVLPSHPLTHRTPHPLITRIIYSHRASAPLLASAFPRRKSLRRHTCSRYPAPASQATHRKSASRHVCSSTVVYGSLRVRLQRLRRRERAL
jgi:hypothetical protein